MIVAIHQPNFAPWLGFFDKMMSADVFVLLDTVPFTKRSYQNRARLKGAGGAQWLTVPVISRGRFAQPTNEVEINQTDRWRHTHLQTLRTLLGKAPQRRALLECLEPVYERAETTRLVEFNLAIIRRLMEGLGIATKVAMASDLGCDGQRTRLLINLVKAAGGDTYLSGPSGRSYMEPELFDEHRVRLAYHEFRPFEYPQLFGDFMPGLSTLDYIANVGFELWRDRSSESSPLAATPRR